MLEIFISLVLAYAPKDFYTVVVPHNPNLPLVKDVIPHRPPHLWLDGVTDVNPNKSADGFWVPGKEHFEGHFEDLPLLMGVKQVESIAQLGAYALIIGSEVPLAGIFREIKHAKFGKHIAPGSIVELAVQILDRQRHSFEAIGHATVDGVVTCEATIIGDIIPKAVAIRLFGSK